VYARGGWRFYFSTPEAMGMALDRCERDNTPCWLYAVDDQVVWQSDAALRVGSKAAWQIIQPTTVEWKTLRTPLKKDAFEVATDLYFVNVTKQ